MDLLLPSWGFDLGKEINVSLSSKCSPNCQILPWDTVLIVQAPLHQRGGISIGLGSLLSTIEFNIGKRFLGDGKIHKKVYFFPFLCLELPTPSASHEQQ